MQHFEKLKAQVDAKRGDAPITIESFAEDWNESQFWVKLPSNPSPPQSRNANPVLEPKSQFRLNYSPVPAAVMWLDTR